MTLEEMKRIKKERGLTYEKIAELSNVPLGTVQKVFSGATHSPRYETVLALEKVLGTGGNSAFREPTAGYTDASEKLPEEYTIRDLQELPYDHYIELIDGCLYHIGTPASVHQIIVGELYRAFWDLIEEHECGCTAFVSPFGVQLDMDERTLVIPDLSIVCDPSKIREDGLYGAPDLVVEVLSPSTRRRDMTI